jgi:uncharacterized membrane protein YesL
MGIALRVIGSSFRQVAGRFEKMLTANLIAAITGLPVYAVAGVLAYFANELTVGTILTAILLGVLPYPGAAGLQAMAREMAAGEMLLMPGPIEGLRQYWKPALRVWLVAVPITAILFFNVFFYAHVSFPLASLAEIAALYALAVWLAAHVYVYPLLLEQEVKRIRLIYRNAFIMVISHPVFTFQVVVAWLLILMICSASGIIVAIGLALAVAIQQNATARMIPTFRQQSASQDPTAAS